MYIFLSALIITPICWLNTFKFISYVSLFANISILFALLVIMFYDEKEFVAEPELHANLPYINVTNLPLFFGIAVFNFEGNGVILNLHASMKNPDEFRYILRNTLIAVISTLIIFSCFSYEAFGDRIEDMITMNLPHNNLTTSVQLLYCLALLGSFPLQAMPAIYITEGSNLFTKTPNPFKGNNPYLKNVIMRTLFILMLSWFAQIIPKFGLFINLTGAFACTALAFILPTLMYNRVFSQDIDALTTKWRIIHMAIIVFGSLCGLISFIMTFIEIIKAFSDDAEAQALINNS